MKTNSKQPLKLKHTAATKKRIATTKKHAATSSARRTLNLKPLVAALALSMGLPLAAQAATITVTTAALSSAGACGLSDAISAANINAAVEGCSAGSGDDNIVFASALTNQTITVTSDLPQITSSVSITGPTGFSQGTGLHISGDNARRIFYIQGAVNVTVENLTLKNGSAISGGYGGAIYAHGGALLMVNNSTLSGNSAGYGGAIAALGATLTVSNSTLSDNSADYGGAIYADQASLTLTSSTLSGNSAGSGGAINARYAPLTLTSSTLSGNSAGQYGGAIYARHAPLTLTSSTLSGNSAAFNGGAIYAASASLTVSNSTLSGNSAGSGGAIYAASASLTVSNSTLSGNSAGSGGAIYAGEGSSLEVSNSTLSGNSAGFGGAIYAGNGVSLEMSDSTLSGNSVGQYGGGAIFAVSASLMLSNSVIAGSGDDCPTAVASTTVFSKVWLQNNASCAAGTGITDFDPLLSGDPLLGPLANNGGPTLTHLPASNSPLIGAGQTSETHDQRGVERDPAVPVIGAVAVAARSAVVSSGGSDGDGGSGALGLNPGWLSLILSLGAVRKYLARRRSKK